MSQIIPKLPSCIYCPEAESNNLVHFNTQYTNCTHKMQNLQITLFKMITEQTCFKKKMQNA